MSKLFVLYRDSDPCDPKTEPTGLCHNFKDAIAVLRKALDECEYAVLRWSMD